MDRLRKQARLKGDEVILLLGNHEFMNLRGALTLHPCVGMDLLTLVHRKLEVSKHFLSHSAEFQSALKRDVSDEEIKTFGTLAERVKMLTTGRIGRSWAKHYISASRLPLHPSLGPPNTPYSLPGPVQLHIQKDGDTIHEVNHPLSHTALAFVHGGLGPTYTCLTPFPSRINDISKSLLLKLQQELKVNGDKISRYPSHSKFYTN
jgi:hypothetical protein